MSKPYYTTDDLMQSIKNRIMFPFSQATLQYADVLQMMNEELHLAAVPAIRERHMEYFTYDKVVPILPNIGKYPIPSRAQGMTLRDLKFSDSNGNLFDMDMVAEEDRAFFQANVVSNSTVGKYFIQGDNVVFTQPIIGTTTGNLNFTFYMRPNSLVRNDRAAIIQGFQKPITLTTSIHAGDQLLLQLALDTVNVQSILLKAGTDFAIGIDAPTTALNLSNKITSLMLDGVTCQAAGPVVTVSYQDLATTFTATGTGIVPDNMYTYIVFDNLASQYTDPDTNEVSDLYTLNCLVDFLQTNPGHKIYNYDVKLRAILPGNVGKFLTTNLQGTMNNTTNGPLSFLGIRVNDYICLANECIIPMIPVEAHSFLAEMTANRILSSLGDKDGYAISQQKLQEMDKQFAAVMGNGRVAGSTPKVFNRNSLLRMGRRRRSY